MKNVFKFVERLLAPRCLEHAGQVLHSEMTDWGIRQYFCPVCRWARADAQQKQALKDMRGAEKPERSTSSGWLNQAPLSLPGLPVSPMRQRAEAAATRAWLWRLRVMLIAPDSGTGVVPVSDRWINDHTVPMRALRSPKNLQTRSLSGVI